MTASLDGKVVVVTDAGPFGALALAAVGAEVVSMPLIEIVPPESWTALDDAIGAVDRFDRVAFLSANAIDPFIDRCRAAGRELPDPERVAAVGRATARRLMGAGLEAGTVSPRATAAGLASEMRGPGRLLLVRVEDGPPAAREAFEQAGWDVTEVAAYRNRPRPADPEVLQRIRSRGVDAVTLASPSAAASLAADWGDDAWPTTVTIACIGPATAEGARASGLPVHLVAPEHSFAGLAAALASYLGE